MSKITARIARLEHKHPFWVSVTKGDLALTVGCFNTTDRALIWARDVVLLYSTMSQEAAETMLPPDDWDHAHAC